MEEFLGAVEKDKKRAIHVLEGAIGTYEKLLTLLLKEAKGGRSREEDEDPPFNHSKIVISLDLSSCLESWGLLVIDLFW